MSSENNFKNIPVWAKMLPYFGVLWLVVGFVLFIARNIFPQVMPSEGYMVMVVGFLHLVLWWVITYDKK